MYIYYEIPKIAHESDLIYNMRTRLFRSLYQWAMCTKMRWMFSKLEPTIIHSLSEMKRSCLWLHKRHAITRLQITNEYYFTVWKSTTYVCVTGKVFNEHLQQDRRTRLSCNNRQQQRENDLIFLNIKTAWLILSIALVYFCQFLQ